MGTVHCLWSCRSYESVQEARRHDQHASEPHSRTIPRPGAVWLEWEGRRRGAGVRTRLAGAHRCASMSPPTCAVSIAEADRREANWSRRREIVGYCVGVLDESVEEKRQSLQDAGDDVSAQRKARGALYAEETKVRPGAALL